MAFGQGRSRSPSDETAGANVHAARDSGLDRPQRKPVSQPIQRGATAPDLNYPSRQQPQYTSFQAQQRDQFSSPAMSQASQMTEPSKTTQFNQTRPVSSSRPTSGIAQGRQPSRAQQQQQQQAGLQRPNRKFNEAYEGGGAAGSSGGARRVMDWFRKRGRERAG